MTGRRLHNNNITSYVCHEHVLPSEENINSVVDVVKRLTSIATTLLIVRTYEQNEQLYPTHGDAGFTGGSPRGASGQWWAREVNVIGKQIGKTKGNNGGKRREKTKTERTKEGQNNP